jgi:hypothetical protein
VAKLWIILVAALPALAQLDSHTLSITSSRDMNPESAEAQILVSVFAPERLTSDEVVAAIRETGLTAKDLTGASPYNRFFTSNEGRSIIWSFARSLALSDLVSVLGTLARFKAKDLELTYSARSVPPLQTACPLTSLLSDALIQAQKVASAAGVRLGSILALAEVEAAPISITIQTILGSFGSASTAILYPIPERVVPEVSPACSLTVTFRLLP